MSRADLDYALARLMEIARTVPPEYGKIRLLMLAHRIEDLTRPWHVRLREWIQRVWRRRALRKLWRAERLDFADH